IAPQVTGPSLLTWDLPPVAKPSPPTIARAPGPSTRPVLRLRGETVVLESPDRNTPPITLSGHTGPVKTACFSADGQRVVTGGADRLVKLWNANSGAELLTLLELPDWVMHVEFTPDGTTLVVGCLDGSVRLLR
ncbi:MAG: WD40 repeat domain-containing protein, partial [Gemmataceae bacterium]